MFSVWNPEWAENSPENIPEKFNLVSKFEVCPQCAGKGTSSAYLGAFTESEWAQESYEFKEEYLKGEYDRTCDTCKGQRVVEVVDRDRNSDELLALYDKEEQENYNDLMTYRMEMSMYGNL